MAWLFLLVAGLCETVWAIGLKYTEGFSRLLPTIGTVVAMVASTGFLWIEEGTMWLALSSIVLASAIGFNVLALWLLRPRPTLQNHETKFATCGQPQCFLNEGRLGCTYVSVALSRL